MLTIREPRPVSSVENEGNNEDLVETELRIFHKSDIKDVYRGCFCWNIFEDHHCCRMLLHGLNKPFLEQL